MKGSEPEAKGSSGVGGGSGSSSWGKQEFDVYLWRWDGGSGTLNRAARAGVQPSSWVGAEVALRLLAGEAAAMLRYAEGSERLGCL